MLEEKDNKALIVSKYGIDCKPYNTEWTDVTWETCTLRKWLNNDFLNMAFSQEEQARIQSATVPADKNPDYNTNPGNVTTDKVFLLSINEANKYFSSDEARKCVPTAYAKAQGAFAYDSVKTADGAATCYWWLRSSGFYQDNAAYVDDGGSVHSCGFDVRSVDDCVRPVLWINLDS